MSFRNFSTQTFDIKLNQQANREAARPGAPVGGSAAGAAHAGDEVAAVGVGVCEEAAGCRGSGVRSSTAGPAGEGYFFSGRRLVGPSGMLIHHPQGQPVR